MDKQEIFDTVARGLIAQGRASFDPAEGTTGIMCRYRSPDGCKCAAGMLITDEEYLDGMESLPVFSLTAKDEPFHKYSEIIDYLADLQDAHDSSVFEIDSETDLTVIHPAEVWMEKWKKKMFLLAAKYELNANSLYEGDKS